MGVWQVQAGKMYLAKNKGIEDNGIDVNPRFGQRLAPPIPHPFVHAIHQVIALAIWCALTAKTAALGAADVAVGAVEDGSRANGGLACAS